MTRLCAFIYSTVVRFTFLQMSDRELRNKKRQRTQREQRYFVRTQNIQRGQRQSKQNETSLQDAKKEIKLSEMDANYSKLSLSGQADAVVCIVFTFLSANDHWKFGQTSARMSRISSSWQASPQQVNLSDASTADGHSPLKRKVLRLMSYSPLRMTIPSYSPTAWTKMTKMTQLRELTISTMGLVGISMDFLLQLTQLVKLKMPCALSTVDSLPSSPLPSSLKQLELFIPGNSKFGFFNLESLFKIAKSSNLINLQVLKLPRNEFYGLRIFEVGTVFPQLKELSFGYFDYRDGIDVHLTGFQSAINLESLCFGIDQTETTTHWETLATKTALRRLTVAVYNRIVSPTAFEKLSQVSQLTHLELISYPGRATDISAAIHKLANATNPPSEATVLATESSAKESTIQVLPRLTTLLIGKDFKLEDATCLSAFSSLTELQFPDNTCFFPELPHLHILHASYDCAFEYYKDQIAIAYFTDPLSEQFSKLIKLNPVKNVLVTMKNLTTLKLHPKCASKPNDASVATYFRNNLPSTVQVETDDSIDN